MLLWECNTQEKAKGRGNLRDLNHGKHLSIVCSEIDLSYAFSFFVLFSFQFLVEFSENANHVNKICENWSVHDVFFIIDSQSVKKAEDKTDSLHCKCRVANTYKQFGTMLLQTEPHQSYLLEIIQNKTKTSSPEWLGILG